MGTAPPLLVAPPVLFMKSGAFGFKRNAPVKVSYRPFHTRLVASALVVLHVFATVVVLWLNLKKKCKIFNQVRFTQSLQNLFRYIISTSTYILIVLEMAYVYRSICFRSHLDLHIKASCSKHIYNCHYNLQM